MIDRPLAPRDPTLYVAPAYVPLDYVRPGLSLAQLLATLRAYRGLSVAIFLSVLALTALAVWLWPRTYTATASVMVNYEVNDVSNGKRLPTGQVGSYIATQVELMQTPELLLAVVDRLGLTRDRQYTRGFSEGGNGQDGGTLRDWVARQVGKELVVFQSQRGSQLIYVSFSADEPAQAAQVANMVVDVYKEQDAKRADGPPSERAQLYQHQLDQLKAKVDQAQQGVTAFRQRNGLVESDGAGANVDALLLGSLNERLLSAQNAHQAAAARAAGATSVSDEVLASLPAQALKAQLGTQEQRLAQLEKLYTPAYPDVQEARAQVATTRRAIQFTVQSYRENAVANSAITQRLARNLAGEVQAQRARMLRRSELEDQAAAARLELASAQAVYRRTLDAYDPILFAPRAPTDNVSVISRATPPVRASKPRSRAGVALGVLAALGLGLGLPLLWEQFHRRVRCRDDLERLHGVPVLVEFGRLRLGAI